MVWFFRFYVYGGGYRFNLVLIIPWPRCYCIFQECQEQLTHCGHGVSPQFEIPQIAQQPSTTVTYLWLAWNFTDKQPVKVTASYELWISCKEKKSTTLCFHNAEGKNYPQRPKLCFKAIFMFWSRPTTTMHTILLHKHEMCVQQPICAIYWKLKLNSVLWQTQAVLVTLLFLCHFCISSP